MELYTVFGLDQPPKKLRSMNTNSEFYYYFPPPLPEVVVIFGIRSDGNAMTQIMQVELNLDGETSSVSRVLGCFSMKNPAMCFDGSWKSEELLLAKEIQEKGRLIKLKISPKCQDFDEKENSFSQDSGISDVVLLKTTLPEEAYLEWENSPKKEMKSLVGDKKKSCIKSPLSERNSTSKKAIPVKRKATFEFEDDDDDEEDVSKYAKTEHRTPKTNVTGNSKALKGNEKNSVTPVVSKAKKMNGFLTPKSAKSSCKNILAWAASPRTPSLMELEAPTGRWGHTMCHTEGQKAIMIGGQGLRHHMCKDSIWQYDFPNDIWSRLEDESNGASRRMGHTAVYNPNLRQIFVFGGSKNKRWFNDVQTLDIKSLEWKNLEVTGKAPTRAYHSCTLSHEELLIFGGVFPNPDPIPDDCSNDVHFFNTVSNSWYEPIVSGEKPRARSGHSANLVEGKLYIFGGWDAPACFNDLWTLDIGFMNFKSAVTSGEAPSPRSWHGSTLSSDNRSIFIHGGYNGREALSDVYLLRLASMSWTRLASDNLVPRTGHLLMSVTTSGELKKQENKILIIGGGNNDGKFFSDISELPTYC